MDIFGGIRWPSRVRIQRKEEAQSISHFIYYHEPCASDPEKQRLNYSQQWTADLESTGEVLIQDRQLLEAFVCGISRERKQNRMVDIYHKTRTQKNMGQYSRFKWHTLCHGCALICGNLNSV